MSEEVLTEVKESVISIQEVVEKIVLNESEANNFQDNSAKVDAETTSESCYEESEIAQNITSKSPGAANGIALNQRVELPSTEANQTVQMVVSDIETNVDASTDSVSEPMQHSTPCGNGDSQTAENYKMDEISKDECTMDSTSNQILNMSQESQSSMDIPPDDSTVTENCYCGKKRNLGAVELQCAGCYKWFHESCISIDLGKCVPFMTYYTFFCKRCSPSGIETFSKKQPNFSQMSATAIANLTQQSNLEGQLKTRFSKDKEVIPFIESNWEYLTSMPRRVKQTWHSTVYKAMMKDNDVFVVDEKREMSSDHEQPLFGLVNQDLSKIGPCYESLSKSAQKQFQEISQSVSAFTSGKGRSAKRRFFGDGQLAGGGKKIKSDLVMPKLPPNGYPLEHPFNKDGYRYILAEPDPHAPFRQEFDESQDWAGKPIPGWLYRKLTPNNVLIALHDRAPQMRISEDRLSATGEKGYCMTRATHGLNRGTWYFEITIDEMVDNAATRLGWSQALGNLQAPLGYDKFSYSWRSRKGTKFHESRGYHFSDVGYGQGDTIGFLIHLPPTPEKVPLPPIFKDKPLVKFKSYLYYEEKDEMQLELKRLKPLKGSKLMFYKNGECMGTAFENIYAGTYFPAASLYKNCTVTCNFGPNFKYPPNESFRGVYEAAHEAIIEQTMTDLLFFTENKGKLRLDNIC